MSRDFDVYLAQTSGLCQEMALGRCDAGDCIGFGGGIGVEERGWVAREGEEDLMEHDSSDIGLLKVSEELNDLAIQV